MTSNTVASALLHDLGYFGPVRGSQRMPRRTFAFEHDFESPLTWPDLAFDTALASSVYPAASRPEMTQLLADVAQMLRERAPTSTGLRQPHMKRALIRRADAIAGASSASNRALVGLCVLTNMHLPADRSFVCAEALLHESIHQYLYATELASGNFCDLGEARTYRSPWSGNRIPLHSLVHASFVWFGLLSLWCQLAQHPHERGAHRSDDPRPRCFATARPSVVFGFAFLGPMLAVAGIPARRSAAGRDGADRTHRASSPAPTANVPRAQSIGEALAMAERGAWLPALASRLERVEHAWQ